jgi:hypothetical protein
MNYDFAVCAFEPIIMIFKRLVLLNSMVDFENFLHVGTVLKYNLVTQNFNGKHWFKISAKILHVEKTCHVYIGMLMTGVFLIFLKKVS